MESPIAVVEPDGAVVVLRRTEGGWARTPLASSGFWPAWSPSASSIALAALDTDSGEVTSTVELFEPSGRHEGTLFRQAPGAPPAIGPRIPGYAAWSPAGDTLSYVTAGTDGLTLFALGADGSGMQNPLLRGAPIFSSWSPDGATLAVHAGSNLTLLRPAVNALPQVLTEEATGFRTPAFSAAGALVFAVVEEGAVRLMRTDASGAQAEPLASYPGGLAFSFRPHTSELFVAMTRSPGNGLFDELSVVNIEEPGSKHVVARGPFAGFFWSPAGDRVVLVIPAQTGDGRYSLQALTPDGRYAGATEGFVPSQDFRTYLGFFDQFALSHGLWAPDSTTFLAAGRVPGDSVHATFGDPVGSSVLEWHVGRGQPLAVVGPGEIGVYPPPGSATG
ncbi:MAG: hypothetical protein ACRDG3_10845 [Tepidiformaceae bacterium]